MRKIGIYMSLLMSLTLSLVLSLINTIASGHFSVLSFVLSFFVSFTVSMLIGVFMPMHKVTEAACRKAGIKREKLSARFFEALVSDLIYTPLLTVVMVTAAYVSATSHGAKLSFLPMLAKSLLMNLVIGYLLVLIFMPMYLKMLMKKFKPGSDRPINGAPPASRNDE